MAINHPPMMFTQEIAKINICSIHHPNDVAAECIYLEDVFRIQGFGKVECEVPGVSTTFQWKQLRELLWDAVGFNDSALISYFLMYLDHESK